MNKWESLEKHINDTEDEKEHASINDKLVPLHLFLCINFKAASIPSYNEWVKIQKKSSLLPTDTTHLFSTPP